MGLDPLSTLIRHFADINGSRPVGTKRELIFAFMAKLKKGDRSEKDITNIIRTALRNNIELTNVADNKANTLLTLNALMVTFLFPLATANIDFVIESKLGLPLAIMILTSLITIFMATVALKPGNFAVIRDQKIEQGRNFSPFFFGNIYTMERSEYLPYMKQALENPNDLKEFMAEDLFYTGKRLGIKMTTIKRAFNVFIVGLGSAVSTAVISLFFF